MKQRHRYESLTETPTEPFPGAWIEQGDIVEVLYEDDDDEEESPSLWYGAEVLRVFSCGSFEVRFVDGELRTVTSEKIRRVRKLKANEKLEIYTGNNEFDDFEVLEVLDNLTIRARDGHTGAIVDGITALQWRRSGGKVRRKADVFAATYAIDVDEGDVVEAYHDDEHWYTGTITNVDAVDGENSYTISFVDGTEFVSTEENIRAISEYQIGERMEIFVDGSYYPCEFLGTMPYGDYYAKCDDGEIIEGFTSVDICRKM
jgi:hypothetical protein